LQVVALEEPVGCGRALAAVAYLVLVEIDGLQSHDGVVLVDPDVDADDQRFGFGRPLSAVVEHAFPPDPAALLLDPREGAAPLLRLRLLPAYYHAALVAGLVHQGGSAFQRALPRFFLKLNDYFGARGLGDVGDEMLDIELVLVDLLLNLPFNLINPAVVLALQLAALVVVVGVIAEEALLGRPEDLLDLLQPQPERFDHPLAVPDVLLYR
jgi:hypothetical protein